MERLIIGQCLICSCHGSTLTMYDVVSCDYCYYDTSTSDYSVVLVVTMRFVLFTARRMHDGFEVCQVGFISTRRVHNVIMRYVTAVLVESSRKSLDSLNKVELV